MLLGPMLITTSAAQHLLASALTKSKLCTHTPAPAICSGSAKDRRGMCLENRWVLSSSCHSMELQVGGCRGVVDVG